MAIWNNTFSRLSLALNKVVCDWLISDTQPERTQGERPRQSHRYTPLLEVNQANISLVVLDNELPEPNSIFIFAIIFEEWPRWQETGLTRETCRSESVWTNSCRSLSWFMVHSRPLWVRSWRNKLKSNFLKLKSRLNLGRVWFGEPRFSSSGFFKHSNWI